MRQAHLEMDKNIHSENIKCNPSSLRWVCSDNINCESCLTWMVARDICGVNSSYEAMNTNHSICINTKHNVLQEFLFSPVPWCRVHKLSDPDLFTISDQKILFYPPSGERIKITQHHQKIQQESITENRWKESAKLPQYSFKRTRVKTELPTLTEFGNIFNFNKR